MFWVGPALTHGASGIPPPPTTPLVWKSEFSRRLHKYKTIESYKNYLRGLYNNLFMDNMGIYEFWEFARTFIPGVRPNL